MRVWFSTRNCGAYCNASVNFRGLGGLYILFAFTSNFMQAYADLTGEMRDRCDRSFQEHHPKNANDIKWSILGPCSFLLDRFPVSLGIPWAPLVWDDGGPSQGTSNWESPNRCPDIQGPLPREATWADQSFYGVFQPMFGYRRVVSG